MKSEYRVKEKRIFKQTRADGTELYFAEVEFIIGTWFGLFDRTETMYLTSYSDNDGRECFFLTTNESSKTSVENTFIAERELKYCIRAHYLEVLRSEVIKYERV